MKNWPSVKKKLSDRKYFFWYGNFFFWFAVLIQKIPLNLDLFQSFQLFLSLCSSIFFGFCVTSAMRFVYKKYCWHRFKIYYLIVLIFIYTMFLTLIWFYGTLISDHLLAGDSLYLTQYSFLRWVTNNYLIMLIWNCLYLGYKIYEEWNNQKLQLEKERTLLKSAQLDVLKYQLNPHFLFNTLNSARTLVQVDPPVAQEMLTQISEFLRYSLTEGKNSTVPLIKEMDAINTYLDIEKIRYKNNLIVEYHLDANAENFEIPVFLILPLVDNAVKHGMKSTSLPLKITVNALALSGFVQIDIINTGKWIDSSNSNSNCTGTGLKNVQNRLENSYSGNYQFEILKGEGIVHIAIKLKRELMGANG